MEDKEVISRHRTLGDGMENPFNEIIIPNINLITTPNERILKSLKPVVPQSELHPLVPRFIPKERKIPTCVIKKPKEPKFVPFEPYKAAVEPMIPKKPNKSIIKLNKSKNNIEINELVRQMSTMRTEELKKAKISAIEQNDIVPKKQWEKEKTAYETDIKNLRETNAHLENQLKFQAQVNSELKTLLVAAVGEDLETRVQHLTEDKLSLARALLNSANHLTSHQEQTEWLSGQCEVWRSKFLASSLMVEELARWKSALTNRVNDLQDVTKQLISETTRVQKRSLETYCSLKAAGEKVANIKHELQYANILELANANGELSKNLAKSLEVNSANCNDYTKMSPYTVAEKTAIKLIQNPVSLSKKQDALCNALMRDANSLAGEPRFLQQLSPGSCCPHCKGEIQNI